MKTLERINEKKFQKLESEQIKRIIGGNLGNGGWTSPEYTLNGNTGETQRDAKGKWD
jgi:hypothetical protein